MTNHSINHKYCYDNLYLGGCYPIFVFLQRNVNVCWHMEVELPLFTLFVSLVLFPSSLLNKVEQHMFLNKKVESKSFTFSYKAKN